MTSDTPQSDLNGEGINGALLNPWHNNTTQSATHGRELLDCLRAMEAYANGRLPPYHVSPHGPGHKAEWTARTRAVIAKATGASQ